MILKRANHSTYPNFLRALSQLFISTPSIVIQFTQTDLITTDTDDSLARDILQCCGPAAVEAYHRGRPYCFGDILVIDLPEPVTSISV